MPPLPKHPRVPRFAAGALLAAAFLASGNAPAEIPPAEIPPAETPPAETPPAETPPAETPPAETPPAEAGSFSEIVVLARRMNRVDVRYSVWGSHLKRCEVVTSSGEPGVDRIVCAVLDTCIAEGNRRPARARSCLKGKIALLAASADPPEEERKGS